jgi:mono/diheme cytochrome c family protein
MDTSKFKTEQEKAYQEKVRHIVLQHCVSCHQQLDLLQLRLVNFDDLIDGVKQTIRVTTKQLQELDSPTKQLSKVKKLKKV